MTELESITRQMGLLEATIRREQRYIMEHGEANDAGEYDAQWEEYKESAQYNLEKWDFLKRERDKIKQKLLKQ